MDSVVVADNILLFSVNADGTLQSFIYRRMHTCSFTNR